MADQPAIRPPSTTRSSSPAKGLHVRLLFVSALTICSFGVPTALVLVGVPPAPPPTTTAPTPTPLRVALIGDSLLAMAELEVGQALSDHELVALDGRPGYTISQHFDRAIEMAANDPDVLVVVLGANDAGPNFTREAMEHDVATLLDALSEVRCVKWVTVQEDFYLAGTEAGSQGTLTLNVTLFRQAAQRPNLEVIDFAPTINERPDWHAMDILHLDHRGNRALADTISQSLECASHQVETAAAAT